MNTVKDWLNKLNKENLVTKPLLVVPEPPTESINKLTELKEQLRTIETTNKKTIQNNKYKEILHSIDITPVDKPAVDVDKLINLSIGITHTIGALNKKIVVVNTTCSSCGQPIDASAQLQIVEEAKREREQAVEYLNQLRFEIPMHEANRDKYNTYIKNQAEWERYHTLYNPSMSTEILDRDKLVLDIEKLEKSIKFDNEFNSAIQKTNNDISAHNARIEVILSQIDTMKSDLIKYTTTYNNIQYRLTNIQVLVKTFSTTGLVAYKIECLVKDLEEITNEYLLDLSDGRFQLSFKVNSSDKLNVVINDNSQDIDILALSNGERARVNIATLLAIRKLMQTLSNSRINLLILDETVESLDVEGKEKLIEVLLKEEHLNTVLVSHSFTHPLIEKVHIVKENNVSRIE
jgi:DNA repair exonuclease SbcCD ATPase subunit